MTTSFDREEFLAGYLAEAQEHVRSANANLLAAESALKGDQPQHRLVRELFRSLHTLKGLSAMVGVEPIVELAHEMESVLRNADRAGSGLSAAAIELLLSGVRAIEQRVGAVAKHRPVPAASRKLLAAFGELQASATASNPSAHVRLTLNPELVSKLTPVEHLQLVDGLSRGQRAFQIDVYPSPERAAAGISITAVRERVARLAEILKVIPLSVPKSVRAPGGLAFALLVLTDSSGDDELCAAAAAERVDVRPIELADAALPADALGAFGDDEGFDDAPLVSGHIRVDAARLDDALERLSALVVTRFRLNHAVAQLAQQGVDVRELSAILSDNHRQLRDLRASITRARMVSVAELLERVPLLVRGMMLSTGKQVALHIHAGRAELDKTVAERLFPAIVHLIRNAVDHAIEAPAERRALGKPEEGSITVHCFERSDTQLELSIGDDGRGIDAAELAKRAGRPIPERPDQLLELVSLPGLSSRDRATSESGRGMGMEIVKRIAVAELGGELTLRTAPGVGTTFVMQLPLSISILDSFAFECGSQPFVVPVSVVDEIVEIDPAQVVVGPTLRRTAVETKLLQRRGEVMPLVALAALFGIGDLTPGKALIVRRQGQAFAFGVDRMLGQQEVVVRPLHDRLVKVVGIGGTTDLGNGKPTLVLDLMGLSRKLTAAPNEVAA